MKHLGFIIIILFTMSCNKSIVWVNDKSEIASLKSRISQLQYQIDSLRNAVTINNKLLLGRTDSLSLALIKANNTIEQSNLAVASIVVSLDSIKSQLKTTLTQITVINNTQTKTDLAISNNSTQLAALNQKYLDLLTRYNNILQLINDFPLITISNGLIAYYPFTGNANDSSGFGNNGIVSGSILTSDRFDKNNSAYYFNGASNYIKINNNSKMMLQPDATISVWIYMENGGCNPRVLESNSTNNINNGMGGGGYAIYTNGSSNTTRTITTAFGTSSAGVGNTSFSFSAKAWHHITLIVYSANKVGFLYIDGTLQSQVTGLPFTTIDYNSSDLYIGNINPNRCDWFGGKIDDLRLYNRALNETEITFLATH